MEIIPISDLSPLKNLTAQLFLLYQYLTSDREVCKKGVKIIIWEG